MLLLEEFQLHDDQHVVFVCVHQLSRVVVVEILDRLEIVLLNMEVVHQISLMLGLLILFSGLVVRVKNIEVRTDDQLILIVED